MPSSSSELKPERDVPEHVARIRSAVERQRDQILRGIVVLVARGSRHLRWDEVHEQAQDVLGEAVERALAHAEKFDASRSVGAWVCGIAARVLLGRRREQARDRRCVAETTLGAEAWQAALDRLCIGSAAGALSDRLDLEQLLAGLDPGDRKALECRYFQGLDGEELARALDAPSAGAARVRLCRALQALRSAFRRSEKGGLS
jgi:RNA polymerase sigma factor (sigma-70 family)